MQITGKSIQRANIVYILPPSGYKHPEAHEVLSLYTGEQAKGSTFVDDPVMNLKIFSFPQLHLKIVFEENRLRVEDETGQEPAVSKIAKLAEQMRQKILSQVKVEAFGFNYDIFFRTSEMIPQREIMKNFLTDSKLEDIKDFGWQFTLRKPQEQKLETYFCKVISPLELAVHVNHHFSQTDTLNQEALQNLYEKCYGEADLLFKMLSF